MAKTYCVEIVTYSFGIQSPAMPLPFFSAEIAKKYGTSQ